MATKPDQHDIALFQLLLNDPDLPEPLQQRIYQRSFAPGGKSLLTALARHPALAEDISSKLAGSSDIRVVKAWAEHPDRSMDELVGLAERETRATVLAILAGHPGLPVATYRTVLERSSAAPVTKALLVNGAVPAEVRRDAARALFHNLDRSTKSLQHIHRDLKPLRDAIKSYPELGAALTDPTHFLLFELAAASPDLDAQSHAELFERYIASVTEALDDFETEIDPIMDAGCYRGLSRWIQLTLTEFGSSPRARQKFRTELLLTATVLSRKLEQLNRLLMQAKQAKYTVITSLEHFIDNPPSWNSELYTASTAAAAARSATTVEELQAAASLALANDDVQAARLVLAHPLLEADMVAPFAGLPRLRAPHDIVVMRTHDPDMVAAFCATWTWLMTDDLLSRTGEPQVTLIKMLRYLDRHPPKKERLSSILSSRHVTAESLKMMPTTVLSKEDLPGSVAHLLSRIVLDDLGSSDRGWAEFTGLLDSHQGSIGELLEIAKLLAD